MDYTPAILVALIFFLYYATPIWVRKLKAHKKSKALISEEELHKRALERDRAIHKQALFDFDNDLRAAEHLERLPYSTLASQQQNETIQRILKKNGARRHIANRDEAIDKYTKSRLTEIQKPSLKSSKELRDAIEARIEERNPTPLETSFDKFPPHPKDTIIEAVPYPLSSFNNDGPQILYTVHSWLNNRTYQVWNYKHPDPNRVYISKDVV